MTSQYYANPNDYDQAVKIILDHGFVFLRNIVPLKPLEILRDRMDADSEELMAYCQSIGGNPRDRGHLQQGPPLSGDFVFPEIAMNEHVNEICCRLFGNRPKLTFYNGNTNYPGSTTQGVHMDGYHHTKEPDPVHEPLSVVVNIPPVPTNASNGAIQLWPDSHKVRTTSEGNHIPREFLDKHRQQTAPIQIRTEPGDVLIRDVRLWHRGVPNPSEHARHMVALIVTSGSVETRSKLKFEEGCKDALEGHSVDANAEYVEHKLEYLVGPTKRIYEAKKKAA